MLALRTVPKGQWAGACQSALLMLDHDTEQDTDDHISPKLCDKVDDMGDKSQSDSDVSLDLYDGKLVVDCIALCTWVVLWYVLGHRVLSPLSYHNCISHLQFLGMDSNCLSPTLVLLTVTHLHTLSFTQIRFMTWHSLCMLSTATMLSTSCLHVSQGPR